MNTSIRPRVVVVGGGFAGMSAVRELAGTGVDVLLVDAEPFTTFQPVLYQVATGGLNPGDVTYSLRAFVSRFANARFQHARVTGVDADARRVTLDDGPDLAYDYLILCCGVVANYFGIPGAEQHARTIYSPRAAIEVRDLVLSNLESVAQGQEGVPEPAFVVVGGGATGVEMAGALAEFRNTGVPLAYPDMDVRRVRLVLVEMADGVLAPFKPRLRAYAADELRRRGVELRLGAEVREVGRDFVVLRDGARLDSAVTVWATGIKVDGSLSAWGLPQARGGRVQVGPDLRVAGRPDIFAAGDVAGGTAEALPQLAQPAIQGGRHAARQILKLVAGEATEPFSYHDKGIMATIGRSDAVLQLPVGLQVRGLVAWIGWLGLHIVTLMSNRNRLAALTNLSVRYVTWKRSGANVIVGDSPRL
ncbi:MAG: NAD(P)/FAD-dependent oxidoreductase [Acidimicrobiales bacterium]